MNLKSLRSNLIEWLRAIFILAQIVVFTMLGGMLLKEANHRLDLDLMKSFLCNKES